MGTHSNPALRRMLTLAALCGALAIATAASAATFTLDGASGADYDSVGDGWFFTTPPGQAPDGVGDAGNNALAVAYQAGVLEMRAMAEFPLAPLAGVAAGQVQTAMLTFRIDDVIGTFGPGSAFDGTASDPIAVYAYPADGTVTVADFAPAGLVPLEVVSIGVVTDASIASDGPVDFTVDVTDALRDAITAGNAAIGILFGTLDTPTATSLDDGPPGVGGILPYLTVETAPTEPPLLGKAQLKCQSAIGKQGAGFAKKAQGELVKCLNLVLTTVAKGQPASAAEAKCRKGLDEVDPKSVLAKARASATKAIDKACVGVAPADIGSPCDAGAATIAATTACVLADHLQRSAQMTAAEYGGSCPTIGAVGLDAAFPALCAP